MSLDQIGNYRFDINVAKGLFKKRSLMFLFAQGFVGVFPWNVITYWFFRYLETERKYEPGQVLATMAPAILVLASGYFVGGFLGDFFFKRTPRGRLLVSMAGVLTGAVLFFILMKIPMDQPETFSIFLMATALFIPFSSPNVTSTVYDITLPEVRSTALSIQYFIENAGAALAPLIAGFIAREFNTRAGHSANMCIRLAAGSCAAGIYCRSCAPRHCHAAQPDAPTRRERDRSSCLLTSKYYHLLPALLVNVGGCWRPLALAPL